MGLVPPLLTDFLLAVCMTNVGICCSTSTGCTLLAAERGLASTALPGTSWEKYRSRPCQFVKGSILNQVRPLKARVFCHPYERVRDHG